jgi:hypothetical protein
MVGLKIGIGLDAPRTVGGGAIGITWDSAVTWDGGTFWA